MIAKEQLILGLENGKIPARELAWGARPGAKPPHGVVLDMVNSMAVPEGWKDEAMIAQAVALGSTIGIVATNQTTLEPTRLLLMRQAARVGKAIDVRLVLVAHALDALRQGDGATHDRLVGTAVVDLAPDVEVIVLAQATMARVLDAPGCPAVAVSVLASHYLALDQVATLLAMGGRGIASATGGAAAGG